MLELHGQGKRVGTMAEEKEPITIKKYANRRLYNTGTSTYVTLEDLAAMVKNGEDFVVYDAKTGEDITRSVLAQIIFEQENKEGQSLLPITFLRQLIRFYGDSMQMLVPRYLEQSIDTFTREQGKFREQMAQAFGVGGFGPLEDQVRRNMEMFEKTFAMFAPFARGQGKSAPRSPRAAAVPARWTSSSARSTRCRSGWISSEKNSATRSPRWPLPPSHGRCRWQARSARPADNRSPSPTGPSRLPRPAPIRPRS